MTRGRTGLLVVMLMVAAIAASAGAPLGRAAPAPGLRAEIHLLEFAFNPKEVTVRAGEVTFVVKNDGSIEHNFVIEDSSKKTVAQIAVVGAGKTEELKVTLRPGAYTTACTLPGHREAGMWGSLRVQP
jgi:uncharacterized cupredoxin-like copper-binding protein